MRIQSVVDSRPTFRPSRSRSNHRDQRAKPTPREKGTFDRKDRNNILDFHCVCAALESVRWSWNILINMYININKNENILYIISYCSFISAYSYSWLKALAIPQQEQSAAPGSQVYHISPGILAPICRNIHAFKQAQQGKHIPNCFTNLPFKDHMSPYRNVNKQPYVVSYVSAYAALAPPQFLLTQGVCWFPFCN